MEHLKKKLRLCVSIEAEVIFGLKSGPAKPLVYLHYIPNSSVTLERGAISIIHKVTGCNNWSIFRGKFFSFFHGSLKSQNEIRTSAQLLHYQVLETGLAFSALVHWARYFTSSSCGSNILGVKISVVADPQSGS
jgi:hypothetical protein